jgi:hypothetical protein
MLRTMRAYVFTCGLVLMRALLSLAMIAGLSAFLGIALMRLACFAAEECFLFMHTRRRRRDRWVSIKWMLVKSTVRALPHRFTQVFNYMGTRTSQFTGHRDAFSNARLTRIERGVSDVALHTNGGNHCRRRCTGMTGDAVTPGQTETELFRALNPPGSEGERRHVGTDTTATPAVSPRREEANTRSVLLFVN